MIEQRLADSFRAAVADEPPLGFDPDETVERAARGRRRRRAVIGASAATSAVAIAAVALFGLSDVSGGDQVQAGGPQPTVAPSPRCPRAEPGQVPPRGFPGSDGIVNRLGTLAPQLLAEHVPGVRIDPPDAGWIAYDCPPNVGNAYRVSGPASQYITLQVIHQKDQLDLDNDPVAGGHTAELISDTPRPDGSRIRVYRTGPTELHVVHFRTDGVIAEAVVSAKADQGQPDPDVVVSEQALTALATDPRLTF